MSDSRLEKFIYAICSMEVSDLPVPLSRIEKLWNCLITGETPDFEPLSRNEKYLMAMLDRYDISNLPAPMSRGEKLLYKIAMGETDLSDVPGYLSRYEELLKYLIENGVLSDFEYVLYTLNQSLSTLYATVEKPVKSAILKGQTLVNLINFNSIYGASNNGVKTLITKNNDGILEYTTTNTWNQTAILFEDIQFKPNTTYTIMYIPIENDGYETASKIEIRQNNNALLQTSKSKGKFSTTDNIEQITMKIGSSITSGFTIKKMKIKNVMLLEGDYTNVDIPYFEGMQSVKMPVLKTTGKNLINILEKSYISNIGINMDDNPESYTRTGFIKLKKDKQYIFSDNGNIRKFHLFLYDLNKNFIEKIGMANTYTPQSDCFIRLFQIDNISNALYQVEENSVATTYEPYKSNILTVNEDVTLRSNGDICDELNLLTGQLTQRIGEDGVVLSQEVVKTVDLTTVDQDGQPTKLKTFNDISHVEINADNIIPSVEVEVATKISETLATLDPQQNDISNTQNKLSQTIDEQSENTDATMMATTEIYEQTL